MSTVSFGRISSVVPLVGTWIETLDLMVLFQGVLRVVPLVGTWIETSIRFLSLEPLFVVPLVGTWIETLPCNYIIHL